VSSDQDRGIGCRSYSYAGAVSVHVYLLSVTHLACMSTSSMCRALCAFHPAQSLAIPPSAAHADLAAIGQLPAQWAWTQSPVLSVGDQRAYRGPESTAWQIRPTAPVARDWGPEEGGPHTPRSLVCGRWWCPVRRPKVWS